MIIAILLNTEDNSKNITFRKQKPANFHAFFLKKGHISLLTSLMKTCETPVS
jgi:hypothetical protein